MKNKKRLFAWLGAALLMALAIGGYLAYDHHNTYISIDGTDYLRSSRELDLSGKPLGELEKLGELKELEQLNLLDTGITAAQFEAIQAALPECRITWSVPFQGGSLSNQVTEITLTELTQADTVQLDYFPNLSALRAEGCRDYGLLMALEQERPELTVSYTVALGGKEYSNHDAALTVADPELQSLTAALALLPRVEQVTLEGEPLSGGQLLELTASHSSIQFFYELDVLGVRTAWDAEFLDLSGIPLAGTEELEALLPLLPELTKVDMVDCGIGNEEMEALNQRHQGVQFVWTVKVCGVTLRTDVTHFMPVKYRIPGLKNMEDLKYCHNMKVMDFGHYGIKNVDFIAYMPELEYLLLYESYIPDLDLIGRCTSLRFLELNTSYVSDFWPLTNLTNLEDLNISFTGKIGEYSYRPFGDITPLLQMTWLDRLWMVIDGYHNRQTLNLVKRSLPNTIVHSYSEELYSIGEGWRHSLNYYKHRDILEMSYFT